ncbi:ribonuclease inhibitor domain-containing protein, partial [Trichomonas vaginalis G3]
MSSLSSPNYIDINERFYSQDGKNLTKVNDISPYIRISAKCELIYNKCFYKLNSLISFTFEENPNLTIIGKESFYECQNITNINLSSCSKLKIISGYAFYRCLKVAEILLPRGLLEIHTFAFCVNGLVTNITIPASVEIIGQEGIYACRKLENVIFEEGSNLTSLEDHVFAETGITSFQIPEKVSYIHGWAFHDGQLTNLSLHPNNNYLIIENNNIVYSSNKSILFFICNKSFQTYEIPNTITTLGEYCLSYSDLKSITLPNSVTTIRSKSFTNSILTSVIIPKNVKSIGDNAFFRCYNLINVTFLGHLDYIGSGIFWDCLNLEHIIFPKSTMIISAHNFITIGVSKVCISLTNKALFSSLYAIRKNTNVSISYLNESNLIITSQLFIMNSNQTIIYEFWGFPKEYYNDIKIPNNVTTIKESAFENSTIKSINFELGSQLSI